MDPRLFLQGLGFGLWARCQWGLGTNKWGLGPTAPAGPGQSPGLPCSLLSVARPGREFDAQSVERRGHDYLAAEAAGGGQAERQVEHVFLVLGGFGEFGVPVRVDDDVAG